MQNLSLKGQFLIAMPEMGDGRFGESVIYIVEHSEAGAMGLMVNKDMPELTMGDILADLDLGPNEQRIQLPESVTSRDVFQGGPVEIGRGFILHSRDYFKNGSSIEVNDDLALTATLEALQAMTFGPGPAHALFALGYCGWGAGQLEAEIVANSWLTAPQSLDVLFHVPVAERYNSALALVGANRGNLSWTAGSA